MDAYASVAEVAVTLSGFSGLLVGLRQRDRPLEPVERFALYYLLLSGLGAAMLALLPAVVSPLAGSHSLVWLCVVAGVYMAALSAWRAWRIVHLSQRRYRWLRRVLGFVQWLLVLAVVLAVIGPFDPETLFALSLWWLVLAAAIQFVIQLFYSFRCSAEDVA